MSLPRAPHAVAFDLDGTLIDSEALVRDAYVVACRAFRVEMSDAQFLSLVGLHRDANDARIRGFFGEDFPLEQFYASTRAHLEGRVAPLKAGAGELLDTLDGLGLPFALATSSGRPWVERHFTAHRLTSRFNAVIARGDYVNGKPDPEPYLKASEALGAAPAHVLALEDSYPGVRAAHAAGCMTVMAPDLLAPNDEMRAKTVHIVETLHEVTALLRI